MNFDSWYSVPKCNFVNNDFKKNIEFEALCSVWVGQGYPSKNGATLKSEFKIRSTL